MRKTLLVNLVTLSAILLLNTFSHCSKEIYKTLVIDHGNIGINTNNRPFNIGHRGSCGIFPEHTVASYERAVTDGVDVLECDVTITKDLKLVCRHESWLEHSTNVNEVTKFADRKKTYLVDGVNITDWFSVDFTLAELKELKAKQTLSIRDQSFNSNLTVATFDEFIQVAKSKDPPLGIYPEIKNPDFINSVAGLLPNGTRFEDVVLDELARHGYTSHSDGCLIQCFNEESLMYLKNERRTEIPLVFCVESNIDKQHLNDLASSGFYGVCAWKDQIFSSYKNGGYKYYIFNSSNFVEDVHDAGLKIHLYTFRNEHEYLAWDYAQDIFNEYDAFFALGVEGYFTDFPATLKSFMETVYDDDCDIINASVINTLSLPLVLMLSIFVFVLKNPM